MGDKEDKLAEIMNNNKSDNFFWKEPAILWNPDRLSEFVPTSAMSLNEKLNAIARFLFMSSVILAFIYRDSSFLMLAITGTLFLILVYEYHPSTQKGGVKEGFVDSLVQMPSSDNPFMNPLLTDHPDRKPAADVEDPIVKEQMEKFFSQGLYRNVNDIWDKGNSQRQYYTNPSTTIPNDRDSFMKWCWNTPYTCKDGNAMRCLKYEDPRSL